MLFKCTGQAICIDSPDGFLKGNKGNLSWHLGSINNEKGSYDGFVFVSPKGSLQRRRSYILSFQKVVEREHRELVRAGNGKHNKDSIR